MGIKKEWKDSCDVSMFSDRWCSEWGGRDGTTWKRRRTSFSSQANPARCPFLEEKKVDEQNKKNETLVGLLLLDDLALIATNGIGPVVKTDSQQQTANNGQTLIDVDRGREHLGDLLGRNIIGLGGGKDAAQHEEVLGDNEQDTEQKRGIREEIKLLIGQGKREGGGLEEGRGKVADNVNTEEDLVEEEGALGGGGEGLDVGLGVSIDGDQVDVGDPAVEGDCGTVDGENGEDKVLVNEWARHDDDLVAVVVGGVDEDDLEAGLDSDGKELAWRLGKLMRKEEKEKKEEKGDEKKRKEKSKKGGRGNKKIKSTLVFAWWAQGKRDPDEQHEMNTMNSKK